MPFLPPLLLGLFAFWCGTFPGAAAYPQAPLGAALVFAAALLGASGVADPLGLGRRGRWLLGALLAAAALSLWLSPVARAGRVGLWLLPGTLLLVPFVQRCWASERGRALGLVAWNVVVALTSGWALVEQYRQMTSRTAMPLGHHNLLAAFLVIALPVGLPALRRRGLGRWSAGLALALAVVALVQTRSLTGGLALVLLAVSGAGRFERARHLVLGLALLALAALIPRAAAIVQGVDSSAAARWVYLHGGWRGALDRPIFGWGPGSTPWTLALELRPQPGVNPPGEVVGEMHSLPLALAYEIGFPGLLLASAVLGLFLVRRWQHRDGASDAALVEAGLAGLVGFVLAGVGGAQLSVTAIPVAAALAAGAALAGEGLGAAPTKWGKAVVGLYVAAAIAVLLPLARAQGFYETAATVRKRADAAPLLARAVALDPAFPLYRARWAWSAEDPVEQRAAAAFEAAAAARGVTALWLRAGALALEAGHPDRAREALRTAMRLDPLSAFAPFQLAMLASDRREIVDCAARAVLAEPRLAASSYWRGREKVWSATLARLEHWPGIDAGWRSEMVKRGREIERIPPAGASDEVELAARIDGTPSLAVSLHLFRRSAWPADVARLRVERSVVRAIRQSSAAAAGNSNASAFPADRCAPAGRASD